MIFTNNNSGYSWFKNERIYFKGYFIYSKDRECKVFRENNAIDEIEKVTTFDEFLVFLKEIEGIFAIIINSNDQMLFATDRQRSFPLYYSVEDLFISDSVESIKKNSQKHFEIDFDQYLELFSNDYLFGHSTVYRGIEQLDLGEACCISNKCISKEKYYYHLSSIQEGSIADYKARLWDAAQKTFRRIKAAINDRPVVLSMSGGYDSRFVGCMLKHMNIKDVLCYSYGKKDSFEVAQSKKNAQSLGFKWVFVEYSDEEVLKVIDSLGIKYLDSYVGHDFTAYIQNFPAVRKLKENGLIKTNSVFITGLCGDMPTGNYIEPFDKTKEYSAESAAATLFNRVFRRYNMPASFKNNWIADKTKSFESLPIIIKDYTTWSQAVDCMYTGTCHSHWFMHMNSVHSFFGYEWLLPYWDSELLNAWYSIPSDIKINQSLYEDWLLNDICAQYGINSKKYRATYSKNKRIRNIKYFVGGILNCFFLNMGIVFRRKYDYNNFAPLELALYKKLSCKNTVYFCKAGIMYLLNQFLLQKRYGVDIMKKACCLVRPNNS